MEVSSVASPRIRLDHLKMEGSKETLLHKIELEASSYGNARGDHQFHTRNALEILRETVRILRYNCTAFLVIATVLICPVSAFVLSNVLVDQTVVDKISVRLLLIARASGISLRPLIEQLCHKLSEMALSSAMCVPLFITLSLLSKAAVIYSVDCTYSRKKVDSLKLLAIIRKIWRRLVSTYLWVCMVIAGCFTSFFVLLVAVCSSISVVGFSPDLVEYAAIMVGLVFSVVFANAIIICNTGIVICVLEDASGAQALIRSGALIKGQTQLGLVLFLGATLGMAFIEGLFEHRVKTLSYGDGSSRIWEGPLLVVMYSFVMLIDSMTNAVFYFSCKSYSMESTDVCQSMIETVAFSPESEVVQ